MSSPAEIDSAIQKIKNGKPSPFYLVFGDQDYLVKQAYDRICEALVPEDARAFNFEQVDGANVEVKDLLDALNTLPMMGGLKVVGVPDCRFLVSKISAADLLAQARERWEQGDFNAALRQLAKVVVLCGTDWEGVQGWALNQFGASLGLELEENRGGEDWLAAATAQGYSAGFPLPKGGDESAALLEGLEPMVQGASTACVLVMAAPAADGRKKIFKFLEKEGAILEFKAAERGPQAGQTANVFLRHQLSQRGLSLETQAAQRLISAFGGDLGLMAKELEKMEAFAYPRQALQFADLQAVGSPRLEENIFDLLGAVGERDAAKALPLLNAILEQEPAQKIFAQLCQEIRLLFLCRCLVHEGLLSAKGAREFPFFKANIHPMLAAKMPKPLAEFWKKKNPYPIFQAFKRCMNFTLEELRLAEEALADADLKMKTTAASPDRLMEEVVLRLTGAKEEQWV